MSITMNILRPNQVWRTVTKLLLLMKLTAFFLVFGCLHLSATSFSQKITLEAKELALKDVFSAIHKQTGYAVVYNVRFLKDAKLVSISANQMSLDAFLSQVLTKQALTYHIREKNIIIGRASPSGEKKTINEKGNIPQILQNIKITGKVNDVASSESIPGVYIRIKGKNGGTITDADGRYTITAGAKDVLEFSSIGYATQEVPVNGRTQLDILLVPSVSKLDEVVVTGYGSVNKSDITGAITSVKPKDANEFRASSFTELLQGNIAGVNIVNNTGEPGGAVTFNIRGATSITGSNQPLIVIDGQPIESSFGASSPGSGVVTYPPSDPLAAINPSDIASIEILKDATSTAIYGSRGANGVVLITTKKGEMGQDKISFSARSDLSHIPKKLEMLSSYEYMIAKNESALNSGTTLPYKQDQLDSISRATNVNWQDEVYRYALSSDYQMSLSGRDKRQNYLLSGVYADQKSVIDKAGMAKGGLRLNYERNVNSRLKVGLKTYLSMIDRKFGPQSNFTGIASTSVILSTLIFNPLITPYDEETGEFDTDLANSPQLLINKVVDRTSIRTVISNFDADYKISKSFNFTFRAGINDVYAERNVYFPTGTFTGDNAPRGAASRSDNNSANFLTEYLLTFNKVLGKKHSINATGAYSYQKWFYKSTSYSAAGFPSNTLTYYNIEEAEFPGRLASSTRDRALQSVITRINYAYDKKYLLTLTGRYDGSTRLAPGNKWQLYPSVGLGWNVHQEDFFKNQQFVSSLKLRASIGVTGNDNISVGASQAAYGLNQYPIGPGIVNGYIFSRMENPFLKWERTIKYNAGADIGFLKRRLEFSVDLYRHYTNDLLMSLGLPSSSGYGNYITNVGEITNWGLDVEATYKLKANKTIQWNIGGNFSVFNNRVNDLGGGTVVYGRSFINSGNVLLDLPVTASFVGGRVVNFYGHQTNGIYQNQKEIDDDPALANDASRSSVVPGMIKYVDTNGDGQITGDDRTIIGSPMPDFTFGFNSDFRYKKLSARVSIFGSYGGEMANLNRWIMGANQTNTTHNMFKDSYMGRWRGEGTSNLYPALNTNAVRLQRRFPDWMVEDASFIRLQSLTLGYTFDLPKKLKVGGIKVFLTGTNLLTITNYTGYDPNVNAFGYDSINSGVDLGTMPQARSYSLGATLNF